MTGLTLFHENPDSSIDEDTLLHGKTLFVISTGDSESVTLELFSQNISVDIGAHSSVIQLTTKNDKTC